MDKSTERIVDIDVASEMRESFLEYSYSVIYSRALPDARDGLKPVQRRIIYQMGEMGLRPDRGHVKSARVTGEVMGKLHPHGDGAIYDALVRMSQPFTLRLPLIDGHGNFGSLDDGPAAARYTEARLTAAATALNESLEEDVVDFLPNYDAQLTEPEVLPAAFPNLLVNGASGIAVGMATNMPPHNLGEVVAALQKLIRNPAIKTQDLMGLVPGPDLPTGGVILAGEALNEAYETGKGTFRIRAKLTVAQVAPRRTGLVVTELPYLVGPERVIEKIRDAVNAKKLEGIHNVVDLTDRDNGLKLVIELKSGINPDSVIEALYRLTPLEESFGINNVALVGGRPRQMGFKELLEVYLGHRIDVTTRRSQNRLDKRKARLHLIEGLQLAVLNIDEVIEVIRTSDTADGAKSRLKTIFDLSELQAEYILELRLRRLTKFSLLELEQESDELRREIERLHELLANEELLRETVSNELGAVVKLFGTPRRSQIIDASGMEVSRKPVQVTELEDSETVVVFSPTGTVFRTAGQIESSGLTTSLRSDVGFVLEDGTAIQVHVADLPQGSGLDTGVDAEAFLGTNQRVVGLIDWNADKTYAIGTKQGVVKRFVSQLPDKHEVSVMSLKEGDRVIGVSECGDEKELVFVSDAANLLTFPAKAVRPQGLAASGMAGINLGSSRAIFFGAASKDDLVLTAANDSQALGATDPGSHKLTPLTEFPSKGRGSMGVRCHKFLKAENQLYFASVVSAQPRVFDAGGQELELTSELAKRDASGSASPGYIQGAI
ncbi:MAG: DNA topoisomerase IV subunit A [Aquiluna sp.]